MARKTKKPAVKAKTPAAKKRAGRSRPSRTLVLVATRKGAWLYHGDGARKTWRADGPHFLGHIINHCRARPARRPHAAGRGEDRPPRAHRVPLDRSRPHLEGSGEAARLRQGRRTARRAARSITRSGSRPRTRTSRTSGTRAPRRKACSAPRTAASAGSRSRASTTIRNTASGWAREQDGTPDGPKLHSIIVDPRNPSHLYFAMSGGGVHETRDKGRTWTPLVQGPRSRRGLRSQHHHVPRSALRAALPEQSGPALSAEPLRHLSARPAVGRNGCASARRCRKQIGDIGFPMVVHPRDADTAWVFPMDGQTVWPRISLDGMPAAFVTRDAGKSWKRLDGGLPKSQAWWTVKRQAMTADAQNPVGLYFGTTSGELWMSRDEGRTMGADRAPPARDLRGGDRRVS